MEHYALEPDDDRGFVGVAAGVARNLVTADDVLRWIASIEPAYPGWCTIWSSRLDAIMHRIWIRDGKWQSLALDLEPTLNRGLQITSGIITKGGKRRRVILRSLLSWCDGGDANIADEYGEPNSALGRCHALLAWQREVESLLIELGETSMRGSGAMTAWRLWKDKFLPRVDRRIIRRIGCAPWSRPSDSWPSPLRPGMHRMWTIGVDENNGHRTVGFQHSVDPMASREERDRWQRGFLIPDATDYRVTLAMPERYESQPEHRFYDIDDTPLSIASINWSFREEKETPVGAEWRRQRDALRAGRAEGWPGYYAPHKTTAGIIEARAAEVEHSPIKHPVWNLDIAGAYPGALAGVLPWPYEWSTKFDLTPASRGGPVGGIARVKLRTPPAFAPCPECQRQPDDCACRRTRKGQFKQAPVVPVRPEYQEGRTGPVQIWPRGGHVVTGTYCYDTIRACVARGGQVLGVAWARSMFDGWSPCAAFVQAAYDVATLAHTAHATNAIRRLSTRLYGKFAMSSARQVVMRTDDAIRDGLSILIRWGDRCVAQTYDPEPPLSSIPVYASTVEARVAVQLAEAEDECRRAGLSIIGLDTDGMLVSGPGDERPAVNLRWGVAPGDWRVKHKGSWAVYARPKFWCMGDDSTRVIERASGVPRSRRERLWSLIPT